MSVVEETVYTIINHNDEAVDLYHVITNGPVTYTFDDNLAAASSRDYHLSEMISLPHPFVGTVTVTASLPIAYYETTEPITIANVRRGVRLTMFGIA